MTFQVGVISYGVGGGDKKMVGKEWGWTLIGLGECVEWCHPFFWGASCFATRGVSEGAVINASLAYASGFQTDLQLRTLVSVCADLLHYYPSLHGFCP